MPRVTKGMIAAARIELDAIRELAAESYNGAHACYRYHAPAASRHIATLTKAGEPLPNFIDQVGRKYFAAMGWGGL